MSVLLGRSLLLAASVYVHRIQCGKAGCKCAQGQYRHEMDCVSYKEGEASRTRVIPKGKKTDVIRMTKAHKRFKRARREIKELFEKFMHEIHKVGRIHVRREWINLRSYASRARRREGDDGVGDVSTRQELCGEV